MVKVAVAGGTGGLGLHIVEAIAEGGKHEVVVFSRKTAHPVLEKLGVTIVPVSYDDPSALARALEGVHTVISTILGTTDDTLVKPQLALLEAAVKAGVKRFAPSEFGVRVTPDFPVTAFRPKWRVADAVQKSGLEYTLFENGLFANYLAVGTPGIGHLSSYPFMFDIEHYKATLAADTSMYHVYTRAEDIGRFVAASLDLEKWPAVSHMQGDRKTVAEVLRLAEQVRGVFRSYDSSSPELTQSSGRKFDVTYLTEEQLLAIVNKAKKQSPATGETFGGHDLQTLYAEWWLASLGSNPVGFEEKNLNELCPLVQPIGVEEFLKKWWGNQ